MAQERASRVPAVVAGAVLVAFLAGTAMYLVFHIRSGVIDGASDVLDGFALLVAFGFFAVTGAVLVARVPENRVGWVLCGIAVTISLLPAMEAYAAYVMVTRDTPDALATFGAWANGIYWVPLLFAALVLLPLLFPDGRLPSPRWRWPLGVVLVCVTGTTVLAMFRPELHGQDVAYVIDNPIGVAWMSGEEDGAVAVVLELALILGVIMAIASIVVRFRRSHAAEREQLKWFLAAVALLPVFVVLTVLETIWPVPHLITVLVPPLVIGALPVAIGVAILRYRLYSIGRVVSRTITYALVTLVLAGLYAGTVLVLGGTIRSLTGEDSALVVAASTLVAAAAFRPVRVRVQRTVDRRFSRARYDAVQMTEAFGRRLRDEIDLADATQRLRETATELFHPSVTAVMLVRASSERP